MPIDILGCASRVVTDEVRHVQLCADLTEVMGGELTAECFEPALYVQIDPEYDALPQLLSLTIGLFCMGETISAHLIGATLDQSFADLETLCTSYGEGADDMVLADEDRLLGSLSVPEHRACFYAAVEGDLVPRLKKFGFRARKAWEKRVK